MATITSPRTESPAPPRITSPVLASAGGSVATTPTSSVRHSFEAPRGAGGGGGSAPSPGVLPPNGPANPSARRNRAALRDYYNLKSKPAPVRTASVASNASDSTAASTPAGEPASERLDDPAFDAASYVEELLRSAGLKDLLRAEGALVSDIRNLDGERKALVYDNYSKLIKAVGTLGEMQRGMHGSSGGGGPGDNSRFRGLVGREERPTLDGVERLGGQMERLLSVANELVPVPQSPGGAAEQLELKKRRRQRETVRWVLDAPGRLDDAVAKGEIDEAESELADVLRLLGEWKGVGGAGELRERCERIVRDAKAGREEERDENENADEDEDENDSG